MRITPDEKLELILRNNFSDKEYLLIRPETKSVPLVAANVMKATRSFSKGQLVYIYAVYWGMNDNAKVVARFRRKQNWICGVIPIKNLGEFRAKIIYEPTVVKKLQGERLDRYLFPRFLTLPKSQDKDGSVWKRLQIWITKLRNGIKNFPENN